MSAPDSPAIDDAESTPSRRDDLVTLTKAKLSALVVITAGGGFLSAWPPGQPFAWDRFLHTLFGTTLAAFGAAVFNQLLEIEADRKMRRTSERPLPAGRMPPVAAFGLGWLLCAFGIVHLGIKANTWAAFFAGATIAVYLFAYTPMKRATRFNTHVGAVSGALPPVIGWVAAGGGLTWGAVWWFALLFFWQMPHFFAINWMVRDEYRSAGFQMLANDDERGERTSRACLVYVIPLGMLAIWAPMISLSPWWTAVPLLLAAGYLLWLALGFVRSKAKSDARKLFFGTLLYLPVAMIFVLVG
ncbi:MAG: heme o synthase [Verrucomicrobiota bacterium]